MKIALKKALKEVSKDTGYGVCELNKLYRAYNRSALELLASLPYLKYDRKYTEEEFNAVNRSFFADHIGTFFCRYKDYLKVYEKIVGNKTDVQQDSDDV